MAASIACMESLDITQKSAMKMLYMLFVTPL